MNRNYRAEWLRQRRRGVFCHYLADQQSPRGRNASSEEWNELVDHFDVSGLARQLHRVGAGYFFITLGQTSGHYIAPNAVYDEIVQMPGRCSRRDLVLDLAGELAKYDIPLLVYIPSDFSCNDPVAAARLGWERQSASERPGKRLAEFQRRAERMIREWSLRWRDAVKGWWVDGCYYADAMYRFPEAPNFRSFAAALRAGNEDAIIAFNPGVVTPVTTMTEYEDYTAGEIFEGLPECRGPWIESADGSYSVTYHILLPMGENWCRGNPRYPDELVKVYTRYINERGGAITWDVRIQPEGLIPEAFLHQLELLKCL